jgi:UDP-2,3-diacylglucosamine pyrophosphatase LpxH
MATLSIDRRFCGPPGSGNGGYTAGRLAALIGDPAEITLRRPPPLETEMRVERAGSRLLLVHGDDLIAEAVFYRAGGGLAAETRRIRSFWVLLPERSRPCARAYRSVPCGRRLAQSGLQAP